MHQAFVCDPGYGRRISGYTGHSAAFFCPIVEVCNAAGFEVVLLWGMHMATL
jgi:hypothetical protein